jgi:hypothetical protein
MFKKKKLTDKDVERSVVEARASMEQMYRSLGTDYTERDFRPHYNAEDYLDSRDSNKFYMVSLLNISTLAELWEESIKEEDSLPADYYMGQINGAIYELNKYEKLKKEHDFEIPNLHREAFKQAQSLGIDRYTIGDKTFVIENLKMTLRDEGFGHSWNAVLLDEKTDFQKKMSDIVKHTGNELIKEQKKLDPDDMYDWEIDQPQFRSVQFTNKYEMNIVIKKSGCKKCSFGRNFHQTSPKNTCGEYQK